MGLEVDEKDFRYPGPKPQFREAGIIMLADAVEAATRSVKDDPDIDLRQFGGSALTDEINVPKHETVE